MAGFPPIVSGVAHMDRFETCHAITAKWEGGWSNHKADPGGKTMYGVTEAVFHAWLKAKGRPIRPVRSITLEEAREIYRSNYWQAVGADRLYPGVDLATYDAAVNAGVSRGRKWLLASLDNQDRHDRTVKAICAARLSFKRGLAIWKTFGKGWTNRVVDIEAKGVRMALEAMGAGWMVSERLGDEAQAAKKKADRQGAGGVASGGGTVAPVGAENLDQVGGWVLAGFVFVALGLTVFLLYRAHINRKRAQAYRREAEAVQ